jgi:hypothetical protein
MDSGSGLNSDGTLPSPRPSFDSLFASAPFGDGFGTRVIVTCNAPTCSASPSMCSDNPAAAPSAGLPVERTNTDPRHRLCGSSSAYPMPGYRWAGSRLGSVNGDTTDCPFWSEPLAHGRERQSSSSRQDDHLYDYDGGAPAPPSLGCPRQLISVDPRKATSTLAALDPGKRTVIDGARFANTKVGYRELMRFAARWKHVAWAVEGC